MSNACIALGSNLGDRAKNLRTALEMLSQADRIKIDAVSAIYETAPVGGPEQGPYLNACAALTTELPPTKLLLAILDIEEKMGRVREVRWGPRIIDLDLLLYETVMMNTPLLELPHPRMGERDFVLIPLADIAPDLIIPGLSLPQGWYEIS
jgi:2-amino-4-hydroxy-6-hydroxymethyldihydropteridine diphosphokinase